jgi:hypothetical protein
MTQTYADESDWAGVTPGNDLNVIDSKIKELYLKDRIWTYDLIAIKLGVPKSLVSRRVQWMKRNEGLPDRQGKGKPAKRKIPLRGITIEGSGAEA